MNAVHYTNFECRSCLSLLPIEVRAVALRQGHITFPRAISYPCVFLTVRVWV